MKEPRMDTEKYRVKPDQEVFLSEFPTADDQGIDKDEGKKSFEENIRRLEALQERLFAERTQSLLIVLQAMDTGGKDSTLRKLAGDLNPQGCGVYGFKAPSSEELSHDFLWRVHAHAPPAGHIAIFNRSHYEDVLIARVHGLAPAGLVDKRYGHINDFEKLLTDHGTRIVKLMLHISSDYQLERLRRRLRREDKHWKFNSEDLKERKHWDDYMSAYEIMLSRCSTDHAPWYVIPAEIRWFRNLLVSRIVLDVMEDMAPQYPEADFNIEDYPPESLV
ncbi:MAG: PPK2 family polyphosphate kinase [Gammaproteobacteria bacterium]|nr:PPK2 family polyphosphate kinase [Gammaproteobacteria bacterium]